MHDDLRTLAQARRMTERMPRKWHGGGTGALVADRTDNGDPMKQAEFVAPPARFERATFGLGSRARSEWLREVAIGCATSIRVMWHGTTKQEVM